MHRIDLKFARRFPAPELHRRCLVLALYGIVFTSCCAHSEIRSSQNTQLIFTTVRFWRCTSLKGTDIDWSSLLTFGYTHNCRSRFITIISTSITIISRALDRVINQLAVFNYFQWAIVRWSLWVNVRAEAHNPDLCGSQIWNSTEIRRLFNQITFRWKVIL